MRVQALPLKAVARPRRLAKLMAPRADALLPRERLFAQLDALAPTPLVWIAAPPGAGKTSLVASWLGTQARPTLWMQIDAADADPASFFHYLGLAARALTHDALPLPLFTPEHAQQVLPFARRHFRELFVQLPPDTVLVFDNVQEAGDASAVPALLACLVEEQPPGFLTLSLSRHEPPPPLARARAARQLALLGAHELLFQRDETLALARGAGHAERAAALLGPLCAQAQGWAAGIVLLLESHRQRGALAPAAPAEGMDVIFDYFATQVFEASTPAEREWLLQLSYLPRMSVPMATALSGEAGAGELLDALARRHLFTDQRFGPAPIYQFHALFRGFLQARAQRCFSAESHRTLARRAAALLQADGQHDDAFALYAQVQAWDDAAVLLLQCAESLVGVGRHQTLADCVAALPAAVRAAEPWLGYWHGVALTGTDATASRALLEQAVAEFAYTGHRGGQVQAMAALLGGWWNEPDNLHWLEPLTSQLGHLLDDDDVLDTCTRASGLVALTLARLMIRPADPALTRWVQRLSALPFEQLPAALALSAGTCLLQFHWGVGDTEACELAVRRTRPFADRPDIPPGARMWFWFWLMTHRVYMADAPAAREAMQQARGIKDQARRAPPFIDFVRWDVTLDLQHGHIGAARERLSRELEPQLQQASRFTQACVDLEWVRCANEEGRYAEAIERGQRALRVCQAAGHDWLQVVVGLSVCCAQAFTGQINDGLATLAHLRTLSANALPLLAASIEAYDALLQLRAGALDAARGALDRAMALRGQSAYVWGPGWNRPAIAALAAFALGEQRHVAAMTRFVHGLRLAPPTPDVEHWPWPVRLRVLDGFGIEMQGAGSPQHGRKSPHRLLELLKALAACGGHDVVAQRLCDRVWPDADGDAAMRSLETSLSRLRRLLGSDDAVHLRSGKVSLNPTWVQLDLAQFAHRLRVLAAADEGGPEWAALAQRALQPYRRALLADEGDAPWLLAERERWRQRWWVLVVQFAAHHATRGHSAALRAALDDAQQVNGEDDARIAEELRRLRKLHRVDAQCGAAIHEPCPARAGDRCAWIRGPLQP